MSLQNLELSTQVITELYRDFLVDVDLHEPIEKPAAIPINTSTSVNSFVPVKTSINKQPAAIAGNAGAANDPAPKPRITEPAGPQGRIKFLGGNRKKIAFIVNCKTDVFLPDTHLDWLGKMLEACKLNLGDIAIANIAKNEFTISDIKTELQSTTVILLGTEPQAIQLPLNFPHFNLQPYDSMVFLNTPSPDLLNQPTNEAKVLKSKLWVCLQKLFKL